MTERRVLLAAVISAVFLAFYAQLMVAKRQAVSDTSQHKVVQKVIDVKPSTIVAQRGLEDEETVVLESSKLRVVLGEKSGAIRSVTLKQFRSSEHGKNLDVISSSPIFQISAGETGKETDQWKMTAHTTDAVTLESLNSQGVHKRLSFQLSDDSPVIEFKLSEDMAQHSSALIVSIYSSWVKADKMNSRSNRLEAFALFGKLGEKIKYGHYYPQSKNERHVPRGTAFFSLAERYFCQSIVTDSGSMDVSILPEVHETIAAIGAGSMVADNGSWVYSGKVYLGPRDYFYLKSAGFEQAFPIGIIGKIGLLLLLGLSFIAGITKNYGVAIIIFAGIVTCLTAPFTVLSFRSMKKMQQLKPEMDKIMAKHKDDPTKANREVFELYKVHKVSPISGCLPMILQMPIFIALFQAISHYVELRGKSFLWISDLSLPDRVATLPMSLPILGNELHLLPIIMAGAMYLQSAISQKTMSAGPTKTPNIMSGPMMSVIFGVMFYQFPSGLVLYWLTNSAMSMVWYKFAS